MTYGSGGNGTMNHLIGQLLARAAGVTLTHIPYRGSAPAMNDLMGGQIVALMESLPTAIGYFTSGRMRPLAVSEDERSPALRGWRAPSRAARDGVRRRPGRRRRAVGHGVDQGRLVGLVQGHERPIVERVAGKRRRVALTASRTARISASADVATATSGASPAGGRAARPCRWSSLLQPATHRSAAPPRPASTADGEREQPAERPASGEEEAVTPNPRGCGARLPGCPVAVASWR